MAGRTIVASGGYFCSNSRHEAHASSRGTCRRLRSGKRLRSRRVLAGPAGPRRPLVGGRSAGARHLPLRRRPCFVDRPSVREDGNAPLPRSQPAQVRHQGEVGRGDESAPTRLGIQLPRRRLRPDVAHGRPRLRRISRHKRRADARQNRPRHPPQPAQQPVRGLPRRVRPGVGGGVRA